MPERDDRAMSRALARLGVRRLLLAIHDASFPSDPDEDLGRGSPATRAADRLFGFARRAGFTGIQLGPQGQTSRDNPSPYDSTIFSRHVGTIALGSFDPGGPYAGLLPARARGEAAIGAGGRVDHRRAHDAIHAVIAEAHDAHLAGRGDPELAARLAAFRHRHVGWLARDARYAAFGAERGGAGFRDWPAELADHAAAMARPLTAEQARAVERYAFGQLLAHEEHARVRARCAGHGLALYGDLQVGVSDADAWAYRDAFLDDYAMGAPPSRTNPEGQPWSYPVLDPEQLAGDGAALALFVARIDKAFAEYDSLRIDHPHGLVCPWVYRAGAADPAAAVRAGARLFESPDLPDHPALARHAIAASAQLDRELPRFHDRWVRALAPDQVARYAVLFDAIAAAAVRAGRDPRDLSCEVLSTMPLPLARVLERHQLGRWRVLQKANLDDPGDVYRSENAAPADWVMLGNHDTAPIFALARGWSPATREAWVRHLVARLRLSDAHRALLAAHPDLIPTAMLAELLASRAENVSIFFADLFGYDERFNRPGVIADDNWSLRLPADFDALYAARRARRAALDLPLAIAMALGDDRPT